jgi:hypothetical protein
MMVPVIADDVWRRSATVAVRCDEVLSVRERHLSRPQHQPFAHQTRMQTVWCGAHPRPP